jgi:hypothetical protein
MATSKKRLAQKHCSNWTRGKCSGLVITFKKWEGHSATEYHIDKKMAGKDCEPEGCHFYDTIVLPSLPNK